MLGILVEIATGNLLTAVCCSEHWPWSTFHISCTASKNGTKK